MFMATIPRYDGKTTKAVAFEAQLPQRVTITGREDFFARAYDDVSVAISVMRELDRAQGVENIIYRVKNIRDIQ